MDLLNIETCLTPDNIQTITNWGEGWTWLAGGTWLFSQAQPNLKVLVDIQNLGWDEIAVQKDYLIIGATCPLIKLLEYPYPETWTAIVGLKNAVTALAASSKVINVATVGGNICLALSVGTLAPVMVALDATYEIWNLQGQSRQIAAKDFQIGAKKTILQPGEILRRVLIPLDNLQWQVNYQRFSIAATEPALAIVVTAKSQQRICCVIAASIAAPRLVEYEDLDKQNYIDDSKANASYRRHITEVLIKRSLSALCNS
jgi:CO/xanthine dehydrogenase FAD-binding subunit